MAHLTLQTERLELTAATVEMLQAEEDRSRLAALLKADVPANWPTPMYDAGARCHFLALLQQQPDAVGWAVWYIGLKQSGRPTLIGATGAIGPPDNDGTIEIGYSLLDQFHGRGYATEALGSFLAWAWPHAALQRVVADTFPHLTASIRVLEKSGFRRCGPGSEQGAIRFELLRSQRPGSGTPLPESE